ncbi:MAG: GAF domain-containing protein [Cyanothece sp. SIO1E1]|nr:GAF domain-containing protein [Cyanothece sp. SIO1E1]
MHTKIQQGDIPFRLVRRGRDIYAPSASKETLFESAPDIFGKEPFSHREKIESVAGILLKVGHEIVGALFINYRHPHHFSNEEKQIIDILAASAAIAIKNQRWLLVLSELDREIITTLDQKKLLELIAVKAVEITAADLGEIYLLDVSSEEIVIQARYPGDVLTTNRWNRTSLRGTVDGIIGWVARYQETKLLHDVKLEPLYRSCLSDARSELCVPLLDKNRGLVGVLNVESRRLDAFDGRDKQRLEALANRVIIALQKVQSNEQRVAGERVAVLNHIARSVFHRMNNHLGMIQILTGRMLENKDQSSQKMLARAIRAEAAQAQEDTQRMRSWLDTFEPIDVCQKLHEASSRGSILPGVKKIFDVPSNLPVVMGNPDQLEDVFYNLIQNAVEAMPHGGTLTITAMLMEKQQQSWVVVQITDTGVGIEQAIMEEIYKARFTTKGHHDHNGEGLWLVKTYVERLGGQVTSESQPGQETKFTVLLPAYPVEVPKSL